MLMVLVLSSLCDCAGGAGGNDSCNVTDLVFRPERMLEMSVGPRMSGRLDTVIAGAEVEAEAEDPVFRAALKSGRLLGPGAVLFPVRNGVPASELGSRTLVGTGGGGGRWLGM